MKEKFVMLKRLGRGRRNKDISAKYFVPKNTLSIWVKIRGKLFTALKKGKNTNRQKLHKANQNSVNQAVFKWFLGVQTQNVPKSGKISFSMLKSLVSLILMLLMVRKDPGKEEALSHLKPFQVNQFLWV